MARSNHHQQYLLPLELSTKDTYQELQLQHPRRLQKFWYQIDGIFWQAQSTLHQYLPHEDQYHIC